MLENHSTKGVHLKTAYRVVHSVGQIFTGGAVEVPGARPWSPPPPPGQNSGPGAVGRVVRVSLGFRCSVAGV